MTKLFKLVHKLIYFWDSLIWFYCLIGFAAQMIVDVLRKNLATNKNRAIPNTNRPSRTKTIDAPSGATDKASR